MNHSYFTFAAFSPDDPYAQSVWTQHFYNFGIYTLIFLVVLMIAFIGITFFSRRQKNQSVRKRLLLARKIGTWLAIIGWALFACTQLPLISLG